MSYEGYPTNGTELEALPETKEPAFTPIVGVGQVLRQDNEDGSMTLAVYKDDRWMKYVMRVPDATESL